MPEAIVIALVALAGGIVSAALGLVPVYLRRRTDKAEAADYISSAWEKLNQAYNARLGELEEEKDKLAADIQRARKRAVTLEQRLDYQSKTLSSLQRQFSDNVILHNSTIEALKVELEAEKAERKRLERLLEVERGERLRLELWVEMLVKQLQSNGLEPVARPD